MTIFDHSQECVQPVYQNAFNYLPWLQSAQHSALSMPWFQPRQCRSHTDVWLLLSYGCVPRARLGHSAWKSCCNDATGQGGCRMGCARLCEACGLQFGHAWPKLIKQAPCIAEMLCTVFMWEFWAGGMNGSLEISAFQLSSSKAYIAILNLKSCLTFRWEKSDEMNCVWIHTKIASTQYEIKTS